MIVEWVYCNAYASHLTWYLLSVFWLSDVREHFRPSLCETLRKQRRRP